MTVSGWEHFPHGADVGVRGFGASRAEAFEQAALAMTAVLTEPANVRAQQVVAVSCAATDAELLLVAWLNELIYQMAIRSMLFGRYCVHIEGTRLRAQAWGEAVDVARHEPAVEIKGATCTELRVVFEDGHWIAQTVLDV